MSTSKPLGGEHRVKVEITVRNAGATERETQPQAQPEKKPASADPKLAPRTFALPKVGAEAAPQQAAYQEHLERLEKEIEEQVAIVTEQVKEIAEEKGLSPSDVTLVWALDITGKADVVCSFCGRPSCTYRPVMYRTKNPEVDLLGDSITVFQEAASRAGVKYGMIVYDEDVLVLRDPNVGADEAERATTLARYTAFRNRHEYPDPNNRGWLDKMLAKWNPADASRRVAGDPADARMFETGFKIFDEAGGALKAMIVVKAVEPRQGLRGVELRAKGKGIQLTGMAVGRRAMEVAPRLLSNTVVAPDAHELREKVGEGIKASLDSLKDQPGS